MAAGVNLESVWIADYWQVQIQELQADVERHLDTLLPTLRKQGFGGEEEIEAGLKLSQAGVQVFFPKYPRPRQCGSARGEFEVERPVLVGTAEIERGCDAQAI